MNKLTKQDRRDLRKLAGMLPPTLVNTTVYRSFFGHQILERDPLYKDADGQPLDPKKRYIVKVDEEVQENGYKKLESVYLREGAEGVKRFMDKETGVSA